MEMSIIDRLLGPRRRERMMQVTNAEIKINRAESRLLSGLDVSIEQHEEPIPNGNGNGGRGDGADEEPGG